MPLLEEGDNVTVCLVCGAALTDAELVAHPGACTVHYVELTQDQLVVRKPSQLLSDEYDESDGYELPYEPEDVPGELRFDE